MTSLTSSKRTHIARLRSSLYTQDRLDQAIHDEGGIGAQTNSTQKSIGELRRYLDMAFGLTLLKKAGEIIKRVSESYEDGDIIILVGYSRGGAEAIFVAYFINPLGLPSDDEDHETVVKLLQKLLKQKQGLDNASRRRTRVQGLILLDPVAASLHWDRSVSKHDDAKFMTCCIAADEERAPFLPLLIQNVKQGKTKTTVFSGTHAVVGGTSAEHDGPHMVSFKYIVDWCTVHLRNDLKWNEHVLKDYGVDAAILNERRQPPVTNGRLAIDEHKRANPRLAAELSTLERQGTMPFKASSKHIGWKVAGCLQKLRCSGRRDLRNLDQVHRTMLLRETRTDYRGRARLVEHERRRYVA